MIYAVIGIVIGCIIQFIVHKVIMYGKRKNLKYDAETRCWYE